MRPISIRFPDDQLRDLRRESQRAGKSIAEYVRDSVSHRMRHADATTTVERIDGHEERIRELEQRLSDLEAGVSSADARRRR